MAYNLLTLPSPRLETASQLKRWSFPRKRESGSLKVLLSPTAWMPASAGMTDYDTVSCGGEGGGEGRYSFKVQSSNVLPTAFGSTKTGVRISNACAFFAPDALSLHDESQRETMRRSVLTKTE